MTANPVPEAPASLDLKPLFVRVWEQRARVLAVTASAALLTLGIAFLLPKWYRSTAVILPPEESDLLSNMSLAQRALSKFPSFGILSEYFTPADIYKAILLSRTVQEEVVRTYDLQKIYRKKSMEKTLKALKGHYKVKLNSDGTISIGVEDRDARRAAAMANTFLDALDRYNVEKRNTQGHRTRIFLERRVAETDSLLRASEVVLRRYEETHHTVAPPAVSSATQSLTVGAGEVQTAADLIARKIMLEVRLGVLRGYLREDNDLVIQTRNELEQLKRRIATLPALQTDILRLMRDNKVQEQLFLLLTAELEQARIREQQDMPTVQILDHAVPPERHSRPRRLLMSIAAGLLAFVGTVVWLSVRDREATALQA
jgi:uncharacterized protein involved in exopolysaccharide biosynthesis